MTRRRARLWIVVLALVGIGLLSFAVRPAGPQDLAVIARQPVLWRGAYHVHSTRSDGSGEPDAIAAAAAAAGLDFVILTDHGDATRPPDPPRVAHGVLLIDGVEISTDDGHYVALDLPAAPYPLAGEGRAVADDVRRLGGLGILAHPDSPKASLAWHDPSTDADGYEWINADTSWRTASTMHVLARLLTYPFNRPGTLTALAHYPAGLFAERDTPSRRAQLALAAVDAHARIGWRRDDDPIEGGRAVAAFPSYDAAFGTSGLIVPWLDGSPSGHADRDARVVLHAIRHRLAYSAVFSMAVAPWLSIDLVEPPATATPGPDAVGAATLVVHANAPADAEIRILRNGRQAVTGNRQPGTGDRVADSADRAGRQVSIDLQADEAPAIYRAEMWLPARRGWPALPVAVSAARGHNLVASRDERGGGADVHSATAVPDATAEDVAIRGWHVEHDAGSGGEVTQTVPNVQASATLRLATGARVSQFAALVADLTPPESARALVIELSASAPMRVSIQLREPKPGEGLRWRHSAFVDPQPRLVTLPLDEFRPIRPASGPVPLDRLHALMFVTDTVNGRPGDVRRVIVHRARWVR